MQFHSIHNKIQARDTHRVRGLPPVETPEVEPVGASEAQKVGFWGPLNLGGWFLGFVEAAAAGWLLAGVYHRCRRRRWSP